jgi:ankyrin repeat protein
MEFLLAAQQGDLRRVQRMLADGDARITDADQLGRTALSRSAMGGANSLRTLMWLLAEGGARITERDHHGSSTLLLAAAYGRITTCQWLLEHGGADITDVTYDGENTIWNMLASYIWVTKAAKHEVTALLRVMVLKGAPPASVVAQLKPEHVRVVKEGARLRAALPAYLARRRALLDTHCPIIAPLRDMVRDYNAYPATTEELWATGLGAAP